VIFKSGPVGSESPAAERTPRGEREIRAPNLWTAAGFNLSLAEIKEAAN
jgi:hypothetical protein